MAGQDRHATHDLVALRELRDEPRRFELFAAMRLLERVEPDRPRLGEARRPADEWVRVEQPPHLNFAPLRNAVRRLEASAASFDRASAAVDGLTEEQAARLNAILMRTERALTHKEGLPRRPWFVHHVYAPGFYTGYGVKTLPGIREAIEQRLWDEAEEQIRITAGVIERLAAAIDDATGVLAPE